MVLHKVIFKYWIRAKFNPKQKYKFLQIAGAGKSFKENRPGVSICVLTLWAITQNRAIAGYLPVFHPHFAAHSPLWW